MKYLSGTISAVCIIAWLIWMASLMWQGRWMEAIKAGYWVAAVAIVCFIAILRHRLMLRRSTRRQLKILEKEVKPR